MTRNLPCHTRLVVSKYRKIQGREEGPKAERALGQWQASSSKERFILLNFLGDKGGSVCQLKPQMKEYLCIVKVLKFSVYYDLLTS